MKYCVIFTVIVEADDESAAQTEAREIVEGFGKETSTLSVEVQEV
jgi:hypothetical protein